MDEMKIEAASAYGKFKSAEELLAAYNALEREFTKRCQLIKTLQTAGEPACAQEYTEAIPLSTDSAAPSGKDNADECEPPEPPTAETAEPPTTQDIAPTEQSTTQELAPTEIIGYCIANADDMAELLSDIPQVMDACIAKYKQRLIGMGATVNAVRGAAVITPVRRPRSLKEAKILADEMLR